MSVAWYMGFGYLPEPRKYPNNDLYPKTRGSKGNYLGYVGGPGTGTRGASQKVVLAANWQVGLVLN